MSKEIEMLNNVSLRPRQLKNLSTAMIEIKLVDEPEWTEFEFITKKKGAYGPTKEECMNYYLEKLETDVIITITAAHGRYSWIDRCVSQKFEVLKDGFQTLTIPVTAKYKIELVAPGTERDKIPGVRIIAKFELKRGQKITAALGQQPKFALDGMNGSGGSFLVLESDKERKLLLAAGGAGSSRHKNFGRGSTEGGLGKIKISGAGYRIEPDQLFGLIGCSAPKNYKNGLTGGIGHFFLNGSNNSWEKHEGGFGGGSTYYLTNVKYYWGAGGGFTGGTNGGGGGSFFADPDVELDHHYVEYGYCKIERIDE